MKSKARGQLALPFELELVCFYGTPWPDHFRPPIGTGHGCAACALRL
jgi:hypothetical protein